MAKEKETYQSGVYTLAEAAALLGVTYGRLHRWFFRSVKGARGRVFRSEHAEGTQRTISFRDLIEARIALKLIGLGHPISRIRKTHEAMRRSLGEHPFCRANIRANKFDILVDELTEAGASGLVDPVNRQRLSDVLRPLLSDVTPDESGMFVEWTPTESPGVLISPKYAFGSPVTTAHRIPTYVLYEAWNANGQDESLVANWYEVGVEEVLNAVAFESQLRKARVFRKAS